MDADLMRLKALLEEGKTRAPGKGTYAAAGRTNVPPPPITAPL
jgi:hypothetical protein